MKRALVFANGRMEFPPAILKNLDSADLIIAADGGTHHCKSLGIIPTTIIGDLDSLQPQELAAYRKAGAEIIQYPSRKDETDLELAIKYAQQKNVDRIYIIGALGARWDMSLANILMLANSAFSGLRICLLYGNEEFYLLRGDDQVDIPGRVGEPISLVPLKGDACGVTTSGLEYPLNNETLYFGSTRGVSNTFEKNNAHIQLAEGTLLCIFNWLNHKETLDGNREVLDEK